MTKKKQYAGLFKIWKEERSRKDDDAKKHHKVNHEQ